MFKFLKSSAFWVLIVMPVASVSLIVACHTTPHKYVGVVTSVSSWNGDATLKTKTEFGKDTTLHVVSGKYERFAVGQVITVWTGGDQFEGISSTNPQN